MSLLSYICRSLTRYAWFIVYELPPPVEAFPVPQLPPASEPQTGGSKEAVATLRIGGAEIEIYAGADAALIEALCRAATHAQ